MQGPPMVHKFTSISFATNYSGCISSHYSSGSSKVQPKKALAFEEHDNILKLDENCVGDEGDAQGSILMEKLAASTKEVIHFAEEHPLLKVLASDIKELETSKHGRKAK